MEEFVFEYKCQCVWNEIDIPEELKKFRDIIRDSDDNSFFTIEKQGKEKFMPMKYNNDKYIEVGK